MAVVIATSVVIITIILNDKYTFERFSYRQILLEDLEMHVIKSGKKSDIVRKSYVPNLSKTLY